MYVLNQNRLMRKKGEQKNFKKIKIIEKQYEFNCINKARLTILNKIVSYKKYVFIV